MRHTPIPILVWHNHTVLVSTGGNIPQPAEPPRYYNSQYLNLIGDNPMLTTGSAPQEHPATEEPNRILHNCDDPINDDDPLPLPMPHSETPHASWAKEFVWTTCPATGTLHCHTPTTTRKPCRKNLHGLAGVLQWIPQSRPAKLGQQCSMADHWGIIWWNITVILNSAAKWDWGGVEWKWGGHGDEPGILVWLDTLPFSHFSISAPTLTYHDAWNRRDTSRERVQCLIFIKSLLLAMPLFGNV